MKRGDLVTISLSGDDGEPRPALVIQSAFFDAHPSVTVLSVTSELREAPLFRVRVEPTDHNGLSKSSEVMIDKAHTVAREKICKTIGRLDDESMLAVNRAFAVFFGFA